MDGDVEFLDRLRRVPEPFSSLRIRCRIWRDNERSKAVGDASGRRERERRDGVHRLAERARTRESELFVSAWCLGSDRERVELAGGARDGAVGVRIGNRWWIWSPATGPKCSDDAAGESWFGRGVQAFLDPIRIINMAALRLEAAGRGTRAGRPVMLLDAWPPDSAHHELLGLPGFRCFGDPAERYRFELDTDRSLILSASAYTRCGLFQTIDVVNVQFDGPVDSTMFECRVPGR